MRILHITDDLTIGGSQSVLVALANAQVANGHRVAVAAGPGELWAELAPSIGRYVQSSPWRRRLRLLQRVWRLLRAEPWDVVHTHQRGVSTAVWLTRRRLRLRHVEHVHSTFGIAYGAITFRADALIACGSDVTHMLINGHGRDPRIVHTIPNGIEDHGVRRSHPTNHEGPVRVVNIARVDPVKDPARFTAVISDLYQQGIDIRATWIGGGELLEDMRTQVASMGLSEVVQFTGSQRNAWTRLADADVLLMTSQREGLPLSVIEAGAAGCAVIAPAVGSIHDIIRHGQNGWLYPADAPTSDIARLVAQVSANRAALDDAGGNARKVYEQGFMFERVVAAVEQVYACERT